MNKQPNEDLKLQSKIESKANRAFNRLNKIVHNHVKLSWFSFLHGYTKGYYQALKDINKDAKKL